MSVHGLLVFRTLGTDFADVGNEVGGPAINVVFQNDFAHARHGLCLLLLAHFQSLADGAGQLVHVVRVDEQRIAQLLRRPGETAQDECAAIVLPGGDEFLGHEIHPVVERSDQANRSRAIEAGDLLVRMVPLEEDDRFPAPG